MNCPECDEGAYYEGLLGPNCLTPSCKNHRGGKSSEETTGVFKASRDEGTQRWPGKFVVMQPPYRTKYGGAIFEYNGIYIVGHSHGWYCGNLLELCYDKTAYDLVRDTTHDFVGSYKTPRQAYEGWLDKWPIQPH